jgi:hypothetical protein
MLYLAHYFADFALFFNYLPHQLRRGFVDDGRFAIRIFEVQVVVLVVA